MADRVARKPRKAAAKAAAKPAKSGGGRSVRDDRLAALETELETLRAELAQAKARLAEMEAQREHLLNRIDWAIDSLHSLSQS